MRKKQGFTLVEIIVVMAIVAGLFLSTREMLSTYFLENKIKQAAYSAVSTFSVGQTFGKQFGSACSYVTSDPDLQINTGFYTTTCTDSGNQVSITVTGTNDLSGLLYTLSNTGTPVISTRITAPIASKFNGLTGSTVNNCIVSDLDLHCARGKSGLFMPTP